MQSIDAIVLREMMTTATAMSLLSSSTENKHAFEAVSVNKWIKTVFYYDFWVNWKQLSSMLLFEWSTENMEIFEIQLLRADE